MNQKNIGKRERRGLWLVEREEIFSIQYLARYMSIIRGRDEREQQQLNDEGKQGGCEIET